ncbi:hypothetical protein K3G39_04750 [Pontibacter sp. HSC-14F20]|uniref:DUF7793 family protein n=1 Tax=Pontibacter sp. HSC-14F20 TaxID=2864136 RepID=UPI001C735B62|nr:hypothetical protein [Pontibacter sp. HSC-14F20]MBX0332542.1 hypothetical protein [Pontibacter sp. HSC-14F20]
MTNFGKEYDKSPIKTNCLELYLKGGILYCIYNEIRELNLDNARECVQDRLNYIGEQVYPSLFDITRVKNSTKEARDYLANEGNAGVAASAILVSSPMVKMAANIYIHVNKPKNPTRMFTNKEEAVQWLSQYKG